MNKKVVVLGGGTGLSTLLKGLKKFPVDITAIVSVCDDGKSTGRLREEFNQVAVGDIRRVLVAMSETEDRLDEILNYRFQTTSDLDGHTVGNLLLTAAANIKGNMSKGIKSLAKVLNLKGRVIPLSEDNEITLMARTTDGCIIEGEHNITEAHKKLDKVYYKKEPKVSHDAIKAIMDADLIVLSMGSIYTSIIPNLICKEIIDAIDKSKANLMYVCNIVTQPGETDDFKASDHINLLNSYLGKKKIEVGVFNKEKMDPELVLKYETEEQKDPVILDKENLCDIEIIEDDLIESETGVFRHDAIRLGVIILEYLLNQKKR
ncbi:MAG: YvcK family protein [Bacilli bacterium]|nr:YvcK family protein [Bacilli bacterium]